MGCPWRRSWRSDGCKAAAISQVLSRFFLPPCSSLPLPLPCDVHSFIPAFGACPPSSALPRAPLPSQPTLLQQQRARSSPGAMQRRGGLCFSPPAVCNPLHCSSVPGLVFLLLLKPNSATAEHSARCCWVLAGQALGSTAVCFVLCKQGVMSVHHAGFAQPRRCEWCCWDLAAFCSPCPCCNH